ncbi:MAG: PAS domain S-box protein, partial [Proteobacteria bacterium]|nr:PAS domain S-box protein [Pseudomonadota bacterium]
MAMDEKKIKNKGGPVTTADSKGGGDAGKGQHHFADIEYRQLFEKAFDAIFILDDSQIVVDVNQRASEIFGYAREEFLGHNILKFIPADQHPQSDMEFSKLKESGHYEKFVGRLICKDGSIKNIEVSSSAVYDNGGEFIGSLDIV